MQYTNTNVTPRFGGTSSAAPVVSGIAALVLSINPNLTQAEVRQLIKDSALPFQGNDPRRNEMGTGIVNAERAVRLAILGTNGVVVDPIPADFIPLNDPLIPFQWHLNADAIGEATASSDINLAEAFAVMNANGFFPIPANRMVTVGVIDDGIASDHDDLNVLAGYDAATDPNPLAPRAGGAPSQAQPRSAGTHGTAVAGVIAARSNNSVAGIGVAPGMPIVGVRLIEAPDLDPLLFSVAVKDAFDFAVARGARVINNSWGVFTGTDPCNAGDDNVVVPGTLGELQGLANALNNNVVVVFAAGNERAKVDGYEINGSPNVLTVGATNNLGRSSSYSNYGAAIDVAAPSNDLPICGAGDPFYTGGTLGIVTTSMDHMALGGSNARFAAFDDLSYGSATTVSIADWNDFLLNHYFRLASRTITRTGTSVTREEVYESTVGRGIIFQIQAGQVELLPAGVFSDGLGNLTGFVQIRVRAATGIVTQDFVVPIMAGRSRSLRRGVVDVSEFYSTMVMITGRAVIAGQNVTFRVTGSERFAVVEGELHERTDTVTSIGGTIPAFRAHSMVAIQGAGTHRTEGLFVRSIPVGGDVRIPTRLAKATMYSVGAVPTPATRPGRVVGAASVDFTLGAELAATLGRATRSVTTARFSRPGTFGSAQASLVAGRWRGMSQGFHTADVNQASIDLANLTFFPSTIVVSSPFGVNSVRSLDRPPVVR